YRHAKRPGRHLPSPSEYAASEQVRPSMHQVMGYTPLLIFPGLGGSHSGLVRPPAKRVGAVEVPRGFESLPLRWTRSLEGRAFHERSTGRHQFVNEPSGRCRWVGSVIWKGERRAASRSKTTPSP